MSDQIPERDVKPEVSQRKPASRGTDQRKLSATPREIPEFDLEDEERRLFAEIRRLNAQLQESAVPLEQGAFGGPLLLNSETEAPQVTSPLTNYTPSETGRGIFRAASKNKPRRKEDETELIDPDEKMITEINKRTEELDRRKLEIEKELMKLQLQSSQKKRVSSSNASNSRENYPATSKDADYDVILKAIRQQDEELMKAADSIRDELRQLKKERTATTGNVDNINPPRAFLPYQPNNPASEFNALKTSYLLSGGQDPNVLRQMNEAVGDALNKQSYPPKALLGNKHGGQQREMPSGFGAEFMSPAQSLKLLEYERENRLLHQELELLRYRENTGESDLHKIQREHYSRMLSLQHEIETVKAEAYVKQLRDQMNPPAPPDQPNREIPQLMSVPTNLAMTSCDNLHSQPYDPTGGFVIFYDFILPLDPAYKKVQLVSSIYKGPHQICSPTILPERGCFALMPSPAFVQPMGGQPGFTLLSTSQPVQRCRPGSDLALVVEVQALNQFTNQQSTIGWTKVLLFDNQMRVLAGRWRAPIRIAPLRTDLFPKDLNTIPQCGLMEIFYRIANYRDSDIQASVKVNHLTAGEYKYTPQSFGVPVYSHPPAPPEPRPETPPSEVQTQMPEVDPRSKSGPPPPPSVSGETGGTKSTKVPRRPSASPSVVSITEIGPSDKSGAPSQEERQDTQKKGAQAQTTESQGKEDASKNANETKK